MSSKELPKDDLYRLRHSLAHIMAQAVLQVRPGATLGFGPPIEDGFYYDFILPEPLGEEDFKDLEKRMVKIIKDNQAFEEENLPYNEAMARLDDMQEPYKKQYAQELFDGKGIETLRFYRNGPFLDMCEGPHVEKTRDIPPNCFKLRSIAGAYWRGDERNVMMTRIYAWAERDKSALRERITAYEEAIKRDHKKLGRELDIYTIDDEIGKGLPLWMPNGTVVREQLEAYMKELEFQGGYQRVATPHIAKTSLYYATGHLPYYKDGMFPFMQVTDKTNEGEEVSEEYVLKPMNCPHHHKIFAARRRSYRELPVRFAEYGHNYRYEDAGAVSGLVRVRAMCMNDAHIYCAEDQIQDEFLEVMNLHKVLYATLGIEDYYMRLSRWDPDDPKGKEKYVDNPEAWEATEEMVRRAMVESGLPFTEEKGEAAFYGPKIDFQFKTVTGREETASTNQLDFAVPGRLDLTYTDRNDKLVNPYVIHRAPAGTHERFIAFLIEHFAGAFPTWLAPLQVRIIPVSEKFNTYGEQLEREFRKHMIRAELDRGAETMGKKIRTSLKQKIPNLAIIGEQEMNDGRVTWRRYGHQEQQTLPVAEFSGILLEKIRNRSLEN